MYVVYHSSDSFAQVTAVSIASLFENNKGMQDIEVFLIEHDMSEENKDRIQSLAKSYSRTISFIQMPDINKQQNLGLKSIKSTWLYDSYCRMYLDEILPSYVDRVLYLDGDVLVSDSLKDLWETDLTDKCAAAVIDSISEEYYELFGLSKTAKYCNSGVILIDLKKWHEQEIGKKVAEYVREHDGYVFFMEQTVLNAILDSKIHILHPRYNVFTLMLCLNYHDHMKLRSPKRFYSECMVQEAINKPCLIHLTTCFFTVNRAWVKNSNHPAKDLYLKYAKLTPWHSNPLLPDTRNFKKRFIDFFVQHLHKEFVLIFAGYLYRQKRVNKIKQAISNNK